MPSVSQRCRVSLAASLALLLLVACQSGQSDGGSQASKSDDPQAAAGRQLFVMRGCVACHRAPNVPEAQGTIGPNLRGVGNSAAHPLIAAVLDNNPDNLKQWILTPQVIKPGTAMPNLGLSDTEAVQLVAFLETLK